jgi:hypothetical protein
MNLLLETLGNNDWLRSNEGKIKSILPETWTHVGNLNCLQLGYKLKLIGIDWRSEEEFGKCMIFLERIGMLLRDGLTLKRNPKNLFS